MVGPFWPEDSARKNVERLRTGAKLNHLPRHENKVHPCGLLRGERFNATDLIGNACLSKAIIDF
jgi:hypothetical protein